MPTDPISGSTGATNVAPLAPLAPEPQGTRPIAPTTPGVTPLAPANHPGRVPFGGSPLELQPPKPVPSTPPLVYAIDLASTVGKGAKNRTDDVRIIQHRLAALGFPVKENGVFTAETSRYLKIFASLCAGEEQWDKMSDRVTATNDLARWLMHTNAPHWVTAPKEGKGFKSVDFDGYNWGTDWTVDAILKAGEGYQAKRDATATPMPPIMINDISRKNGEVLTVNRSPEHKTHRNGMDLDIRLPRKGGETVPQEGTQVSWNNYDRDTMFLMIDAFATLPAVTRILLHDPEIKKRAEAEGKAWAEKLVLDSEHYHHAHIDVKPKYVGPM